MDNVRGQDGFEERWLRVVIEEWDGRGTFIDLLNGRNRRAGYTSRKDGKFDDDRSAGELAFARYVGFWFDRNDRLARYIFEERADLEKYHDNKWQKRDMYEAVRTVEWPYTDTPSFFHRLDVARSLEGRKEVQKADLVEETGHSPKTVGRCLRYFREENAVELDNRGCHGSYWTPTDRLTRFLDLYDQPGETPRPVVPTPAAVDD